MRRARRLTRSSLSLVGLFACASPPPTGPAATPASVSESEPASKSAPAAEPTEQTRLFAIAPAADAARVGLGFFSHTSESGARDHVHADDFRLEQPASVQRVRIWVVPVGAESLDSFVALRVDLFALDPERGPTTALCTAELDPAMLEIQATGRRGGEGESTPGPEFRVDISLPEACPLDADTDYALSVGVQRGQPEVHWQWQDGEHRDRISWSRPLVTDRVSVEIPWIRIDDVDSAFELWGQRR